MFKSIKVLENRLFYALLRLSHFNNSSLIYFIGNINFYVNLYIYIGLLIVFKAPKLSLIEIIYII
jgi:hypothetical protein